MLRKTKLFTISIIIFGGINFSIAVAEESAVEEDTAATVKEQQPEADPLPVVEEEPSPPMFGDRAGVWGKVGGSVRVRPEFRDNADFSSNQADELTFIGIRSRIYGGFNYAEWFESKVQIQDARNFGAGNSTTAYLDNIDLHLGYLKFNMLSGALGLTIGKQQLVYGDQRLIGHLEWANKPRTYDAIKLTGKVDLYSADLFYAVFTPGTDGNTINGTSLAGLYNRFEIIPNNLNADFYVINLHDSDKAVLPGAAYPGVTTGPNRDIYTVGIRARGGFEGLDAGFEAVYQLGQLNRKAGIGLQAFAAHIDAKFTDGVSVKPFVRIEANYATGDDPRTGDVSEQFVNLFPTNHLHYGFMDLQNWSNALNFSLGAGLTPYNKLTIALDYWLLGRATVDDAWFNAGGKVIAAPGSDPDHDEDMFNGHELDLTAKWVINQYVKFISGASVFIPSGFAEVRGSDPQFWAYSMIVAGF